MPVIQNISMRDELLYVSTRLPVRLVGIIDQIADRDMKTRAAVMRDLITKSAEEDGLVRRPNGPVVTR